MVQRCAARWVLSDYRFCILHLMAPMTICMFLPCLDESPLCNTDEKQKPKFCCILLASLNIMLLNLSETSGRYHPSREKFLLLELDAFKRKPKPNISEDIIPAQIPHTEA